MSKAKLTAMPVLSSPDKRFVVEYTQGELAGLSRIVGTRDELMKGGNEPPVCVPAGVFSLNPCGLTRVTSRMMIYREFSPEPAMGKMGEFHPSQK